MSEFLFCFLHILFGFRVEGLWFFVSNFRKFSEYEGSIHHEDNFRVVLRYSRYMHLYLPNIFFHTQTTKATPNFGHYLLLSIENCQKMEVKCSIMGENKTKKMHWERIRTEEGEIEGTERGRGVTKKFPASKGRKIEQDRKKNWIKSKMRNIPLVQHLCIFSYFHMAEKIIIKSKRATFELLSSFDVHNVHNAPRWMDTQ